MKSWQDVLFVLLDISIDLSRSDKSTYLLGAGLLKSPLKGGLFWPSLGFLLKKVPYWLAPEARSQRPNDSTPKTEMPSMNHLLDSCTR